MPVAARGKTHPRIHAAKLLVRIGRQLYRVCPMQRGSRGKSRGWCWWHELFRGSRRFESVVESRFLFGLFSFSSFLVPLFSLSLLDFSLSRSSFFLYFPFFFHFVLSPSDRFESSCFSPCRARIELCKGWGLCGGLNIYPCIFFFFLFFLFPFGSRYAVCDREESVVLITFWQVCPPSSLNLSFYLLLGFLSMVFSRKKISLLPSFLFFFTDINYRSLIK